MPDMGFRKASILCCTAVVCQTWGSITLFGNKVIWIIIGPVTKVIPLYALQGKGGEGKASDGDDKGGTLKDGTSKDGAPAPDTDKAKPPAPPKASIRHRGHILGLSVYGDII